MSTAPTSPGSTLQSQVFAGQLLKQMSNSDVIEPGYYKDQLQNVPGTNFCDWWHEVLFTCEGKEYLACFSLSYLGDNVIESFQLLEGALVVKETPNERNIAIFHGNHPLSKLEVIQPANVEYFQEVITPGKAKNLVIEDNDAAGLVASGTQIKAMYRKDGQQIKRTVVSNGERLKANLTFTPRGLPLWWGNEPFKKAPLSRDFGVTGTEETCYVDGSITFDGKELKVTAGRGLSEHVWLENYDWMKFRYSDWTWFHADQLCGVLSRAEMEGDYDYEWGSVYLEHEKRLSPCTSVKCTHKRIAWSPEQCRFLPIEQEMVGETADGVLRANLKGILKPWMMPGIFSPNYVSGNIQGWVFTFWSIAYELTGTFTYHDGRVITLTNGRGVNEPQCVSPIT